MSFSVHRLFRKCNKIFLLQFTFKDYSVGLQQLCNGLLQKLQAVQNAAARTSDHRAGPHLARDGPVALASVWRRVEYKVACLVQVKRRHTQLTIATSSSQIR